VPALIPVEVKVVDKAILEKENSNEVRMTSASAEC
jgi:hypothetical protein